jgi:hypothetical protein
MQQCCHLWRGRATYIRVRPQCGVALVKPHLVVRGSDGQAEDEADEIEQTRYCACLHRYRANNKPPIRSANVKSAIAK